MYLTKRRATRIAGAALAALLLSACRGTTGPIGPPTTQSTRATTSVGPIVVAVGDIACDPEDPSFKAGMGTPHKCRQKATSDLALSLDRNETLDSGSTACH